MAKTTVNIKTDKARKESKLPKPKSVQKPIEPTFFDVSSTDAAYTRSEPQIIEERFLIQINKSNLLGYFASALIYPPSYEMRELALSQRTIDIQSRTPDYLLLTNGFSDLPDESQVLIDVVLSDFDKKKLVTLSPTVNLLPYPLPISRVKKLFFANRASQENSKAEANTFSDAFLPVHLFDIWGNDLPTNKEIVSGISKDNIPQNDVFKTNTKDHFDRVLGMLAFMKNADLYYENQTHDFSSYSDKYFKVLSLINPVESQNQRHTAD